MDTVAEITALFYIHETEEPSLEAVKGAIDSLSKLEEATDVFTAFGSSEQLSKVRELLESPFAMRGASYEDRTELYQGSLLARLRKDIG
jgi:hypothetical protein